LGPRNHLGRVAAASTSERARDLENLIRLDGVSGVDVVETLQSDSAFHAVAHFLDIIFKPSQRCELTALTHYYAVAKHLRKLVAIDDSVGDLRASHHALALAEVEDLLDQRRTAMFGSLFGREQPFQSPF